MTSNFPAWFCIYTQRCEARRIRRSRRTRWRGGHSRRSTRRQGYARWRPWWVCKQTRDIWCSWPSWSSWRQRRCCWLGCRSLEKVQAFKSNLYIKLEQSLSHWQELDLDLGLGTSQCCPRALQQSIDSVWAGSHNVCITCEIWEWGGEPPFAIPGAGCALRV